MKNDGVENDKALPSVEAHGDLAPFEDLRAHIASTALQVSEAQRIAASRAAETLRRTAEDIQAKGLAPWSTTR